MEEDISNIKKRQITVQSFSTPHWRFLCRKGPIWGTNEIEQCQQNLMDKASAIDRIPDAFFGNNVLEIHFCPFDESEAVNRNNESLDNNASNHHYCNGCLWAMEFSPIDVINGTNLETLTNQSNYILPSVLQFSYPQLQVLQAAAWERRLAQDAGHTQSGFNTVVERFKPHYDWTCSSKFWGRTSTYPSTSTLNDQCCCLKRPREQECLNLHNGASLQQLSADDKGSLPYELLTDTSLPISWLQQCDLFSDDLADAGINTTDVKIRVMPTFWFLLYRQSIRVDRVALRQTDVRVFHKFGESTVLREFIYKEASYNTMQERRKRLIENKGKKVTTELVPQFEDFERSDTIFRVEQRIPLPYENNKS